MMGIYFKAPASKPACSGKKKHFIVTVKLNSEIKSKEEHKAKLDQVQSFIKNNISWLKIRKLW